MKKTEYFETEDEDVELLEVEPELEDFVAIVEEKRPRKKSSKPPKEYVNKDEMWQEIRVYYNSLGSAYDWEKQKLIDKKAEFPDLSTKLATMVDDIATKMGYMPNFLNYSYLDEMRGDAKSKMSKMLKAIRDCSFKCFSTHHIIEQTEVDGKTFFYYKDKKNKIQKKEQDVSDKLFKEEDRNMLTMNNNIFGYMSRVCLHAYLNRIKKEKLIAETKKKYQEEIWEKMLSTDLWSNVRRPKYIDADESDSVYEGE
jgi:hypothetical protein